MTRMTAAHEDSAQRWLEMYEREKNKLSALEASLHEQVALCAYLIYWRVSVCLSPWAALMVRLIFSLQKEAAPTNIHKKRAVADEAKEPVELVAQEVSND